VGERGPMRSAMRLVEPRPAMNVSAANATQPKMVTSPTPQKVATSSTLPKMMALPAAKTLLKAAANQASDPPAWVAIDQSSPSQSVERRVQALPDMDAAGAKAGSVALTESIAFSDVVSSPIDLPIRNPMIREVSF
jgi:hypothetical protein